jgi:transposase
MVRAAARRLPDSDGGLWWLPSLGPQANCPGLERKNQIIAAHLVTPYRLQGKGGKNDANDAAAVCEAASRPNMRFVPVKTTDQQGILCVHRLREGLKEERTASINRIRVMLTEFGLVAAKSPEKLREKLTDMLEDASNDLSGLARLVIQEAYDHWKDINKRIEWCDERIDAHVKDDAQAKAAKELVGVGSVTASAVVAKVGDFHQFRNGAQFGAWLGVTPRQNSSGGKNICLCHPAKTARQRCILLNIWRIFYD